MLANVTQNLIVAIVPVNDPIRDYRNSGYRAYVTNPNTDRHVLEAAMMASGTPSTVGFGQSMNARIAVLNAMDDYADKFGMLCVADTKEQE